MTHRNADPVAAAAAHQNLRDEVKKLRKENLALENRCVALENRCVANAEKVQKLDDIVPLLNDLILKYSLLESAVSSQCAGDNNGQMPTPSNVPQNNTPCTNGEIRDESAQGPSSSIPKSTPVPFEDANSGWITIAGAKKKVRKNKMPKSFNVSLNPQYNIRKNSHEPPFVKDNQSPTPMEQSKNKSKSGLQSPLVSTAAERKTSYSTAPTLSTPRNSYLQQGPPSAQQQNSSNGHRILPSAPITFAAAAAPAANGRQFSPTSHQQKPSVKRRLQVVHVYQDSNGNNNRGSVEQELEKIKKKDVDYQVHYHDTFTLGRTYYKMLENDHRDAIVLISIGTNDIRLRRINPNSPKSQRNPHNLIQRMLTLLQRQTKDENIVVIEAPQATWFNVTPYNEANSHICQDRNVRFANTLVSLHFYFVFHSILDV